MKLGFELLFYHFLGDKQEKHIFDGQRPTLQYGVRDTKAKL